MRRLIVPARQFACAAAGEGATSGPRLLTVSAASELGIVLALALMFPFMIHILPVPDDTRLGPRLLPMFYAPLLAALLGRTQSAFLVALLAPWLNWLLTRHPTPPSAVIMMVQLLTFVAVVRLLLAKVGARWFLAAPAYLLAFAASTLLVALFPNLIGGRPVPAWASGTVTTALPGVAILVLINWLAFRFSSPGSGGGGGPVAA
jgi:hypothetical protein